MRNRSKKEREKEEFHAISSNNREVFVKLVGEPPCPNEEPAKVATVTRLQDYVPDSDVFLLGFLTGTRRGAAKEKK